MEIRNVALSRDDAARCSTIRRFQYRVGIQEALPTPHGASTYECMHMHTHKRIYSHIFIVAEGGDAAFMPGRESRQLS